MNEGSVSNASLPAWQWPSPDRTAWERACRPCDPFDRSVGRAMIWKESTRHIYRYDYGRWLAWLQQTGELDRRAAPADRVTEARVRAFYESLQDGGLAAYTIAGALMGLSRVLSVLAPNGDFRWISIASRRLHGEAKPLKDLGDGLPTIEEILKLAYELMWEAEHGRFHLPTDRAIMFRDGLIIALFTHRALRIANLSDIQIGTQLERQGDGWKLVFSATEMKGGRRFEAPWPEELVRALEHYIEVHRPVLLRQPVPPPTPSGALWISQGARPMDASNIRLRVQKWTAEELGVAVNPHDFRRLAATTIATEQPDNVGSVPYILAHSSLAMSEKHYNKAKQVDASLLYQEALAMTRRRKRAMPVK
jgi:integrase